MCYIQSPKPQHLGRSLTENSWKVEKVWTMIVSQLAMMLEKFVCSRNGMRDVRERFVQLGL